MIRTKQFALAGAFTAAIAWSVCSALVLFMPQGMMRVTAHMFHMDLSGMTWTLTWSGFFMGLGCWSALAGLSGLLFGVVYNRMNHGIEASV